MRQALVPPLLVTLLLIACSTAEPSPTPDLRQFATAAVETFQAQLTQTALVTNITSTPSQTASPSETTQPSETAKAATDTVAPQPDRAEWVAQSPADGSEVGIGQKFDTIWVVRNTGSTTWNRSYSIRYFGGAALGERAAYYFKEPVPPDTQVKIIVDMVAPNYPGTFNTIWVLTNDQGENFYTVYLTITVVKGPTKTPTKRPTLTLTPTP